MRHHYAEQPLNTDIPEGGQSVKSAEILFKKKLIKIFPNLEKVKYENANTRS